MTGVVTVGRIGKPHGVRGEVTFLPDTDAPEMFVAGATFLLDGAESVEIATVKPYRDRGLLLRFVGISDRDSAEALRGRHLQAATRRDLEPGQFWPEALIGLRAVDSEGGELGTVTGVELGAAQDRLVITAPDGKEARVPFVDELVGDPDDGSIVIRDPGGLFEL